MAIATFGVTPESVRKRHFPHQGAFSASSNPSALEVSAIITEQAARLSGKLRGEDLEPSSITDTDSDAWAWCALAVRLASAIEVMRSASAQDPEVLKAWRADLRDMWTDLAENGYLALGSGVTAPAQQADGPSHHIDEYGLETPDDEMSPLTDSIPRRSDKL
jgi:hypothetical protein